MGEESAACPVGTVIRWVRGAGGLLGAAAGLLIRPLVMAVLDRIDLDALVARVDVNRVAERVDVERIVDRVGVNQVADRVDIDAILARIDLVGLTREVLHEIDLGQIVRDTGGGMTVETVQVIRLLGRHGDRNVNRLADRVLRRAGRSQGDGAGQDGR
ncbi:hypothetical protein ACIBKX_04805 [Streptomyces sp. NPDC050658]|uniref:hypothetical protein n=1 Tax=unclassified Streptomyces TaxID=2593676 RepID=UPI003426EF4B